MLLVARLSEAIAAVCPIIGVRVTGPSSGGYDPAPEATGPQITAANAALAGFDWSQGAQDLWESARMGNPVLRFAMVRLSADRTNTTVNLADVTGLSFQLKANTHYYFKFAGGYTTAAATTGLRVALNGPAAPTTRIIQSVQESATAYRTLLSGTYNNPVLGVNSGGSTPFEFSVEGNLSTNSAGGTMTLRFASETAGSEVRILAGSWGELREIGA